MRKNIEIKKQLQYNINDFRKNILIVKKYKKGMNK